MQAAFMIAAALMAAFAVEAAIKKQSFWCGAFVFLFVIDMCGYLGAMK